MDLRKFLFFLTMPFLVVTPLLGFTYKPVLDLWQVRASMSQVEEARLPFSQEVPLADGYRGYVESYNLGPSVTNKAPLLPESNTSLLTFNEDGVGFLTTEGTSLLSVPNTKAVITAPAGVYTNSEENSSAMFFAQATDFELVEDSFAAHAFFGSKPELKLLSQTGVTGAVCVPVLPKNSYISSLFTKYSTIPLDSKTASMSVPQRANKYASMVNTQAAKYNLSPSLIFAIMHVESAFNPNAVSSQNAHGLMQIVLPTAGAEVHRYLGKTDNLNAENLRNPETNIKYGTAYLHLLNTAHLQGIINPLTREYCMIAAYNGGSARTLRVFGDSPSMAIARINSMSPQEVYQVLVSSFPTLETRNYIKKVVETQKYYFVLK